MNKSFKCLVDPDDIEKFYKENGISELCNYYVMRATQFSLRMADEIKGYESPYEKCIGFLSSEISGYFLNTEEREELTRLFKFIFKVKA